MVSDLRRSVAYPPGDIPVSRRIARYTDYGKKCATQSIELALAIESSVGAELGLLLSGKKRRWALLRIGKGIPHGSKRKNEKGLSQKSFSAMASYQLLGT